MCLCFPGFSTWASALPPLHDLPGSWSTVAHIVMTLSSALTGNTLRWAPVLYIQPPKGHLNLMPCNTSNAACSVPTIPPVLLSQGDTLVTLSPKRCYSLCWDGPPPPFNLANSTYSSTSSSRISHLAAPPWNLTSWVTISHLLFPSLFSCIFFLASLSADALLPFTKKLSTSYRHHIFWSSCISLHTGFSSSHSGGAHRAPG